MRFERMRSRVSSSGAWRSIRSSNVRLASSIIAHSSPFISIPCSANRSGSTRHLLVAELAQAERVREPLRRVDREHGDLLAGGRRSHRDRRRGGRLADAARAGADADPLALEQVADVQISLLDLVGQLLDRLHVQSAARTGTAAAPPRWREPSSRRASCSRCERRAACAPRSQLAARPGAPPQCRSAARRRRSGLQQAARRRPSARSARARSRPPRR